MRKNPQLEKKGFKVLKSTCVDHSPKDRYGNIWLCPRVPVHKGTKH